MSTLQNRLKTARRSIVHHASRLKKKKNKRTSTLSSIVDPATMLLKAALDSPMTEDTTASRVFQTQTSFILEEDEHETGQKSATDLEQKMEQLQTCEKMIQTNGSELIEAVSHDLSVGIISKSTLDRLVLFKMTANAMVEAAFRFTTTAKKEDEKLRKKVEREREWFRKKKSEWDSFAAKKLNGAVRRTESKLISVKFRE
uniref:Oxysterol-binding protein n=1 Tax=Panagrolaimus sp. JU765 TaxID=591449 RepID=A0AC34RG33_9BILA